METNEKIIEDKKDIAIKDDGLNKEILKNVVDEETLKAIKDGKLNQRALVNAFLELAEQMEEMNKIISSLYSVLTTITAPFLGDWLYELNQNIMKSQKNTTKKQKNNIQ